MKRLVLLLMTVALLTACGSRGEQWITGLVTELQTNDSGELTALIVREGERETGILLTEETFTFPKGDSSGTREELRAAFQAAVRPDIKIRAVCSPWRTRITTAGGEQISAYKASYIRITGRMERGAVTMGDGTPVDVLEDTGERIYQLADGRELLRVQLSADSAGFDSLAETARKQVLDYYEERGPLYDERAELEKTYALYQKLDGAFISGLVEQSVSLTASSDRVIYFLTTVTLPTGDENGNIVYSMRLQDAFDRETGAHIGPWELFTVPKDVVMQTLLDKGEVRDPALRAEMMAVPWEGRILFRPDGLSVEFEPGTLPSQEHGTGLWLDYDAGILAMMQDWAVPNSSSAAVPGDTE